MINLNHSYFEEPLEISGLTCLVIETRSLFAKVTQAFYQYRAEFDEIRLYDDNYKNIKPSDLILITDILGFDINSTAVLKIIYKDLELQISEKPEIKTKIEALLQEVTNEVNAELLDFEIDLESDEITFPEIFKALGVQVEVRSDTIFERVFEILQVFKYLTKKRLIIFFNLSSYMTAEEMKSLEEYADLQQIDVLLVENQPALGISLQYVLDNDFVIMKRKNGIM